MTTRRVVLGCVILAAAIAGVVAWLVQPEGSSKPAMGARAEPGVATPVVEVAPSLIGTGTQAPREQAQPQPVAPAKPERVVRPESAPVDVDAREGVVRVTGRVLSSLTVAEGARVILPTGRVYLEGDLLNMGTLDASKTDLVLDGGTQSIEGPLTVRRLLLKRGLKRVTGKSRVVTTPRGGADPLEPELIIAPGASLLIEEGALVKASDPYAFRVEGELLLDGGRFECSFANGDNKKTAHSWPEGGSMTIYRGTYMGHGDQDFGRARIVMHDGAIIVSDDIWNLGADLTMHGGTIANAKYGGAFHVRGRVDMLGGTWHVGQRGDRGLAFGTRVDMRATGGQISIRGSHRSMNGSTRSNGGIMLGVSVALHDLVLTRHSQVDPRSEPGARIEVGGTLTLGAGLRLADPDGVVSAASTVQLERKGGAAGQDVPDHGADLSNDAPPVSSPGRVRPRVRAPVRPGEGSRSPGG